MDLQEKLLALLQQYPQWAAVISLAVSTLIAIAGLLPSVFVTAANMYFFGFTNGLLISIAGESLGAAVSFGLYRYLFRNRMQHLLHRHPRAQALSAASGQQAVAMVLALRLLPMVPSGIVTFAAAIGHMGFLSFVVASTLGKVPALLLEAALVLGFLKAAWPVQAIMVVVAAMLAWYFLRKPPKA
jgi:uncharacterized membrane protein YdjX (TVP38/TMEM64 family)